MTDRATELLKALRFLTLLRRAPIFGHLDDHGHRCQHANASLKTLGSLLAFGRKAQFAVS